MAAMLVNCSANMSDDKPEKFYETLKFFSKLKIIGFLAEFHEN